MRARRPRSVCRPWLSSGVAVEQLGKTVGLLLVSVRWLARTAPLTVAGKPQHLLTHFFTALFHWKAIGTRWHFALASLSPATRQSLGGRLAHTVLASNCVKSRTRLNGRPAGAWRMDWLEWWRSLLLLRVWCACGSCGGATKTGRDLISASTRHTQWPPAAALLVPAIVRPLTGNRPQAQCHDA